MIIKYRVWASFNEIKKVECERETESSVWIDGRRNKKRTSDFYNYFDTFEDAKDYLVRFERNLLNAAISAVERSKKKLAEAQGLTEEAAGAA